jgi:antitoxin component YwqK of YwqJK toxin-antitoxin module
LSIFGAQVIVLSLLAASAFGQAGGAHPIQPVPGRVPGTAGETKSQTRQDGFTRQTFHDNDKKIIKEIFGVKDTIRNVPHGRYVSYFLNGKVESRGQFTNNETSGVWEFFFETGSLKMRGILFKGANYGMWEYYFESGQKSMEGIINGRDREGEWKTYYENGHLREVGGYEKNQRQGHWKTYFEDGVLRGEIDYANDHGRYIEYYQSGKVRAEGPKAGSQKVGYWRYFAEDGTLQSDGEYTAGKKSGTWTDYYPSGKPSAKGTAVNDSPTGPWQYWFEDGKPAATGSYDHGKKTGKWSSYATGGQLKSEIVYADGKGQYREYYERGNLKTTGLLVDDKREGTWEFYLENGQREGTCDYKAGKGLYVGYFPSGALQTKGAMDGDLKTGTWEIYENDGTLSGYYRPFYDDKKFSAEIAELAVKTKPASGQTKEQPQSQAAKKTVNNRHTGYFTPRYNEANGVIFGTNPIWLAAGQLPLAIEFYLQERLGHEFEFIGIRDPFFTADNEVAPGKQFQRGYSIAIKQKFYNPVNAGMWYFGHEIRFTNVGHFVNEFVPSSPSTNTLFMFNATEQRVEWGLLLGYRIMRRSNSGGLTVDAFASTDIGYRTFDADETNTDRFANVPQNSFSTTFHFGVNIGNMFSFR